MAAGTRASPLAPLLSGAATRTRGRAALTLCHGAAIRQASQINSRPVQENRQLSTGDNAAFVLRLQVQGQLPVLHCGRRGDTGKESKQSPLGMPYVMEDGSTTPPPPQGGTSASWSPPGLPTSLQDNAPGPSGVALPASATSSGPTPTCTYQHHPRIPIQPQEDPPSPAIAHKARSLRRGGAPRAPSCKQLRPPSPPDPEAGAVEEMVAGKPRGSAGLTGHMGQEGPCMSVTISRCLGHEAG